MYLYFYISLVCTKANNSKIANFIEDKLSKIMKHFCKIYIITIDFYIKYSVRSEEKVRPTRAHYLHKIVVQNTYVAHACCEHNVLKSQSTWTAVLNLT